MSVDDYVGFKVIGRVKPEPLVDEEIDKELEEKELIDKELEEYDDI